MNTLPIPRTTVEMRTCKVCGVEKPLTREFFFFRLKKSGWRPCTWRCRTCDAAAARTNWRSDPDARAKDKARRAKKRDAIREYDRMRARRDRAKKRIIHKKWREANLAHVRAESAAASSRRRARKLASGGSHTAADIRRQLHGQRGLCWWCSKPLPSRYQVDHRIPLSRGGSDGPENIVISCAKCNQSKGAKLPHQFAGRLL